MADDWDLDAVVRSCNQFTTTFSDQMKNTTNHHHESTDLPFLTYNTTPQTQNDICISISNNNNHNTTTQFVSSQFDQYYYNNFLWKPPQYINQNTPTTITNTNTDINDNNIIVAPNSQTLHFGGYSGQQQQMQYQYLQNDVVSKRKPALVPRPVSQSYSQTDHNLDAVQKSIMQILPKPKLLKKKIEGKKTVRLVTKENLNTDIWSWRKYGRKPIKGSPYPRNYYRCSSWKGCSARKQMERSCNEPNLYILTFTGEHHHALPNPNHRNSLAGTTRTDDDDDVDTASSSSSSSSPPPQSADKSAAKTVTQNDVRSTPDFDFGFDDLNFDLFDDVFFDLLD